jgi:hypothetical protein
MQQAKMQHIKYAEEYLQMAADACTTDPLIFNELGSVFYAKMEYDRMMLDTRLPLNIS